MRFFRVERRLIGPGVAGKIPEMLLFYEGDGPEEAVQEDVGQADSSLHGECAVAEKNYRCHEEDGAESY